MTLSKSIGVIILIILFIISVPYGEQEESKQVAEKKSTTITTPSSSSSAVFHGSRNLNLIALTYDDGPNRHFTPRLLEVLKQEDVPATFFWLGEQVKYYPQQAKQLAEMGFEIGNHTFDHKNPAKLSYQELYDELLSTQEIIKKTVGITPRLFRPPYGSLNKTVRQVAKELDLQIIMWSLDTDDWRLSSTKEKIVSRVMKEIRPGDIILMHDRNTRTIEATAELIPLLRERGYRFVTVTELLKAKQLEPEINKITHHPLYRLLLTTPLLFR
ncbi:polysaccharide deacetylase family protein [Candidatus Sumerlaeota bacterium]|nr:polysaccharide deacetylase family protein [Candidatus Sumerlaeota bacterium]